MTQPCKEWNCHSQRHRHRDYPNKRSQTEKDKYPMISLTCGILKKDTNKLNSNLLIPPLGNDTFVLWVYDSISRLEISLFVSFFKIPHVSDITWFVFLCLTSLSMIISRSIRVAADGILSFFLWLSNIPLCIYTKSSLSAYLLMDIWVASMFWLL